MNTHGIRTAHLYTQHTAPFITPLFCLKNQGSTCKHGLAGGERATLVNEATTARELGRPSLNKKLVQREKLLDAKDDVPLHRRCRPCAKIRNLPYPQNDATKQPIKQQSVQHFNFLLNY